MRITFFSILGLILISSCTNEKQPVENISKELTNQSLTGKSLMENKCYSCHSPKVAKEYLLAPPMVEVKEAYLKKFKTEKDFINGFKTFLSKPTKDKAIMKNSVEKHGLMPFQGSSKEEVSIIAKYIFNNDIAKPDWWNKNEDSSNTEMSYTDIGLKYALTTKKALGKTLMTSIEREGTNGALSFCNTKAIPITDSMSTLHNAKIKRVSDKPRNPNNKANQEELAQIDYFKSELKAQNKIIPVTIEKNNNVQFYYPIITNGMCLQCHGVKNEQIKESTIDKLAKLYPTDKATGYKENEVRGIWSIVFEKE